MARYITRYMARYRIWYRARTSRPGEKAVDVTVTTMLPAEHAVMVVERTVHRAEELFPDREEWSLPWALPRQKVQQGLITRTESPPASQRKSSRR